MGLIQSIFLCRAVRELHSHAEENGGTSVVVVTSSSLRDEIKAADNDNVDNEFRRYPPLPKPPMKPPPSRYIVRDWNNVDNEQRWSSTEQATSAARVRFCVESTTRRLQTTRRFARLCN